MVSVWGSGGRKQFCPSVILRELLGLFILVCSECHTDSHPRAQLARIRQMSGQVSRGSAGEYQADERAGVAQLSWRVSGR